MEQIIARYFYNKLDKKEYFFVEKGFDNLFIYLIKNENHYELINKNECKDFGYDYFSISDDIYYNEFIPNEEKLDLFEIVYNQFDKNVYIISIQSFGYRGSYININTGYDSKKFNIKIFKENKFISSDLLYSKKFLKSADLIYEDNHSKKIYILSLIEKKYIMIEIKEYISEQEIDIENFKDIENIVYSEKDIKTLNDFIDKSIESDTICDNNRFCKHIFYGYNGNFLYLSNNFEGTLSEVIVIDLFKRKIIKQFILNIEISSFENWGLQNIIISSKNSIYIFDPYTFQIITKYSNIWENGYSIIIQTFFLKENNFYGLFINSSEIIVIDLFKRKIIKQFILNIDIYSFENWGSQNIIILSNNSIYIFDPYTFQITTKYSSIWEKDYPAKIETYFSKENNFYGLFINSSEFKLMYLNKNK